MKKKFLAVGLMAILAFTSIPYCNVNAETRNGDAEEVLIIEEEEQINDIDYSTEAIILDDVELSDVDYDDLNELLDDGVSIFKTNGNGEEIEEYFEEDDVDVSEETNILGYQISKSNTDVNVTAIDAEFAFPKDECIDVTEEDYIQLANSVELTEEDCLVLAEQDSTAELSVQITDEQKAFLQSNSVAKSYAEKSRTTYFYRTTTISPTGAAVQKGKEVPWHYKKIGYTTLTLYAINAKGNGEKGKRYDAFYTTALVGASNGFSLLACTVQNRLYDQHDCSIIDMTQLSGGDDTKKTASIGLNVSAGEKGLSAAFSGGFSYSYNPSGYKIKNTTYNGDEMQPNWECSKSAWDAEANGWIKVTPMILVKSPNGKDKNTKVSARVKNLIFKNINTYAVTNRSGSEYVYLNVKNHKEV